MYARRLPARHGLLWLLAAFRVFRMNPPLLSALTLGWVLLVMLAISLPPVGPLVVQLALPAMILVIANGCRAVESGRNISSIVLTQGVKSHSLALVRLGGLNLLGWIIILFIATAIEGATVSLANSTATVDEKQMVWIMARRLVISLPVIAAFWFAPLLVGWNDVTPLKAVFFSLVAAVRNWHVFVVYSLAVVIVAFAVPMLLLVVASLISQTLFGMLLVAFKMAFLFILVPTMMAGIYISYRDVFQATSDAG
jgi:hypothetical protein